MAEPARTSPLQELARPGRSVPGPAPVTLTALPFTGKLILRGDDAVAQAAAGVLGFALPPALHSAAGGSVQALWLGPDEWLLLVPAEHAAGLTESLRAALAGLHHAIVEVGDRLTGIALDGPPVREVLNAGCPLDLHPAAFTPGSVARTVLGKAAIILHRDGTDRFVIHLNGSFAPYAWLFIENAAREYGFTVAT